jgi:hypothetical protein
MNPTLAKIRTLLAAEGSEIARACEQILQQPRAGVSSFAIPLKNARHIYLTRASLNAERGNPIKGFDELARALKVETSPSVEIHSVEAGPELFMVFTTVDLSRLLGILLFPPNASAYHRF